MLSICIPVYNYDVSQLVFSLHKQIIEGNFEVEILIIEDGSDINFISNNKQLADLAHVKYFQQPNQGRARTRNNLGSKAIGNNLIFIDCDCLIQEDFIANYLKTSTSPVVIGGLTYGEKPKDKSQLLRWKYGIKRECKVDYTNNGIGFLSSNFMINRELFLSIKFDENMNQYGHEDTLLGICIRERGIEILQINNPVIHLGIDNCIDFLRKTESALSNFNYLLQTKVLNNFLANNNQAKIFNLKSSRFINKLVSTIHKRLKPVIKYILSEVYPSLFLFDLYKVLYIFHLKYTYNKANKGN